ncbi:IS66 family transposase [Phascolarctobacterium succinatutens]|uniref:IS66 family transposase n=1 Tax=Phascolarctobacterium succinatutens TaxID=626940 RepID=UPI003A8F52C0
MGRKQCRQTVAQITAGNGHELSPVEPDGLTCYLQDGHCDVSNNTAENSIRPFTVGRKNWLFSNSPKGAKASAIVYSLIETAKANDLDPERYLKYLFEKLPNTANFKDAETLDQYLPWATEPQEKCKG